MLHFAIRHPALAYAIGIAVSVAIGASLAFLGA